MSLYKNNLKKYIKTFFLLCLEEKKNESVGLYDKFLAQEINNDI